MKKQGNLDVKIIPFNPDFQEGFKILNYEWIDSYFEITDHDVLLLNNPKREVIDKGGFIFFAKERNKIVGCIALEKITPTSFEVSKMAVTPKYQGQKIGKQLMDAALRKAKNIGLDNLILYTNPILKNAIALYKKYGFYEVPNNQNRVKRAVLKMQFDLPSQT